MGWRNRSILKVSGFEGLRASSGQILRAKLESRTWPCTFLMELVRLLASLLWLLFGKMGGHDHCAARECHDGRSSRRGDVVNGVRLSFHVFPRDHDARRLWVSRVNRADLTVKDVTKSTVLCSLHFHEGRRTTDQPHPINFAHANYQLCRPKSEKRSSPSTGPAPKRSCTKERRHVPERLSTLAHRAVAERLSSQEKTIADLSARLGPTARAVEEKKGPRPFMSWRSLSPNINKFRFYTGLPTTLLFIDMMQYLAEPIKSLHLRPGDKRHGPGVAPAAGSEKMGRPRALSPSDELLIVLVWLRHAFNLEVLADMFGLSSSSQVSYILNAWIPFLAHHLGDLLKWPSKEAVRANLPESFREDPECAHVRVILDCYEVWIERPSSLSLNAAMYSDYKGHTTYKVLVGVTPTGYVSFVSAAFPGAISDPEITRQSGLLTKLDDGDTIMADKGFTLAAADLQPRGLKFTLPPFREGNKQMPAQDVAKTRKVANKRIVVENAIGRMKCWALLKNTLCLHTAQSGHVSDIVKLVAILANCGPPLRK